MYNKDEKRTEKTAKNFMSDKKAHDDYIDEYLCKNDGGKHMKPDR